MARPLKVGLDYFAHDVDAASDPKLAYIVAQHGGIAYAVYFEALALIYKAAAFAVDDIFYFSLHKNLNCPIETVKKVISSAVKVGLFDKCEWKKHRLVSSRIKRQLKTVQDVRKSDRNRQLQSVSDNYPTGKPCYPAGKPSILSGFPVVKGNLKESKENYNKERERTAKEDSASAAAPSLLSAAEAGGEVVDGSLDDYRHDKSFVEFWKAYPESRRVDPKKTYDAYSQLSAEDQQAARTALKILPEAYTREHFRYMPAAYNYLQKKAFEQILADPAVAGFTTFSKLSTSDNSLDELLSDLTQMRI